MRFTLPRLAADSRFGRRLFLLILVLAILPLAVSGWLSSAVVTTTVADINRSALQGAVRQAGRSVDERLMSAADLLAALPAAPAATAPDPQTAPGVGRMFADLSFFDGAAQPAWTTAEPADARRVAQMLAGTRPPQTGLHHHGATLSLTSVTAADDAETAEARIWLIRWQDGRPRWVARLAPAYLWEPLTSHERVSAWRVTDADGRVLLRRRNGTYPAGAPGADDGPPGAAFDARFDAPLAPALSAGPWWRFSERSLQHDASLQGRLPVWLALLTAATLVGVAGLGGWQIRRTLVPLQRLTEGTRRLAAGAAGTRVAVPGDDEFGTLAKSFNDMASHLETQFDQLAGLSAIDRDILQGTPIETLVHRVLQRLNVAYPGAPARVSWIDRHGLLQVAWHDLPAAGGERAARTSSLVLDAAALDDFGALAEDRCETPSPSAAGRPWLPNDAAPELRCRAVLPLRRHGNTLALVALALPATPGDDALQPARELRDRLAVAFAAHARERELLHRANHDGLTGLANRYGLHQALEARLAAGTPMMLLFIDLDHFKDVNDSRGHAVGDALLCQAAERLQAVLPTEALVARPGGDEFAVVLDGDGLLHAQRLADRVVAALSRPFKLEEGEHVLGASVGIALAPLHGQSGDELLRRADVALYDAKSSGRGRHRVFDRELDMVARERVDLLADLRRALQRREFVLHYQPRVDPSDGRVRSAEALVRWQHPTRGLLSPGAFIELAESSGLIEALGQQVLEIACAQLARWHHGRLAIERLSVNVSARQLASGELPARVQSVLAAHDLPPRLLELEVTESLLASDNFDAHAQLAQLRDWGITIALDDFGTGYSSMATLRNLPIDVMKIDRAFVADLCHDAGARAVANAIVALARSMELTLVAEGVENDDQAQALRTMGCDELQGYLYSRPLPPAAFEALPGLAAADLAHVG